MTERAIQTEPRPSIIPAAQDAAPLGHKVVRSFTWVVGQTLGTKAINTGAQIVLAWLLAREEFGLIGLAYTVTAFVSVLQQAGLREVLIHRHAKFNRWANPVFWMSACLGVGGMMLTWAAIPLATRVYHAPQLAGILLILSVNSVLSALTVVPQAKLQNALRFRALSVMTVTMAVVQAIVACALAGLGWGASAIAVSAVAGTGSMLAMLWTYAPHPIKSRMQIRRWQFIMGDSAAILATGVLLTFVFQGDYMALGIFHTTAVTGLYYFAFTLSMQTISLFTGTLSSVLFPALSKLQKEPKRQTDAFIRAGRVLALVAIPVCLAQAAVSDPLIRLIFPTKWYEAIPVMQILCVAMAFRAVGSPGGSMMQSQGRFRPMLLLTTIYSAVYLTSVLGAAFWGGIISVAIAEAVCFCLIGPINFYVAIFPVSKDWTTIARIYWPPLVASVVALAPGLFLADLIPWIVHSHVLQITVILALGFPIYVLVLTQLAREDCSELWRRLASLRAN